MTSIELQRRIESSLKDRFLHFKNDLYRLTWKSWAMPSGPPICALRASVRRTSDNGSSGWPTPCTPNGGRSVSTEKMDATGRTADGRKHASGLEHAVKFATGWATPTVNDTKSKAYTYDGGDRTKPRLALTGQARGAISNGSPAPTASSGQLNPDFSRWLMGFPEEWGCCAATATRSSRK